MPEYMRAQTGVGTTNPILLDVFDNPWVGFQAVVSGTATYTVEHSNDARTYAFQTGVVTQPVNWFADANVAAKTISADGNFIVPVQWVRLNVTAGTGTVTLTVRQNGPGT